MPEIHGKAGSVSVGGSVLSGVHNWTITYVANVQDATDFADTGTKKFVAGTTQWSGSVRGFKYGTPLTPGSFAALFNVEAAAIFKESGTAGQQWSGQIIINSFTPTTDINGLVTYDFNFQGTGALTIPTA